MTKLEDNSILERSAIDEFQHPLPQKACEDRTIYLSRNQYGPFLNIAKSLSKTTITDFGFAVCGDGPHYGAIQIEPFRAPEVILNAGWTYSADIWNLGVMVRLFYHFSKLFFFSLQVELLLIAAVVMGSTRESTTL